MSDRVSASYVLFRLGDEEYGLPVATVSGIIRYEEATPVPRSPEAVLGVVNLRGRVIPIVDLRKRFTRAAFEPGPMSRIVVAEGQAGPVGLAVDSASEVAEFPIDSVRPVPEGVLSGETARAFTGVVERDGDLVILLDLDEAVPRREYAPALSTDASEEGALDV